jgi:hypothetical protein
VTDLAENPLQAGQALGSLSGKLRKPSSRRLDARLKLGVGVLPQLDELAQVPCGGHRVEASARVPIFPQRWPAIHLMATAADRLDRRSQFPPEVVRRIVPSLPSATAVLKSIILTP